MNENRFIMFHRCFLIKKCIKAGSHDHRGHLMPLDATDLPGCKDSVESDELGFLKRLGFEDTDPLHEGFRRVLGILWYS